MDTALERASYPQIAGSFAVYTQYPLLAQKVLNSVRAGHLYMVPFGTITLEIGERIDWVNIRYGVEDEQIHVNE